MPKKMSPLHPGEVLREEFMIPMNLSAYRVAKSIGVPPNRIQEIARENKGISTDTALRLGKLFGTTPMFWMNLQNSYDLAVEKSAKGREIDAIEALTA
jgi:addiction module HigA family antidote